MWGRRAAAMVIGFSVSLGIAGCGGGGSQTRDAAADRPANTGGASGTASGGGTGTGSGGMAGSGGNVATGGASGSGGIAGGGTGGAALGGAGDSTTAGGRGGGAGGGVSGGAGRGGGGATGGNAGGAQSGGRGGNGGTGTGGRGTGGAATGGSNTGGAAGGGAGNGGGGAGGVGGTPVLATGMCVAPCALKFAANPISGLAEGAILYVNLTTGAARLRDSAANPPSGETALMQFSFDAAAGSNHGYHLSFSGGNLWDEWTEPYEYDTSVGMYSVRQFLSITMEMVETSANKLVLLTFYLVDHGVVIQSVRFPTCTAGTGACRSAADCPIVTTGAAGPVATNCDMTCSSGLSCSSQCTSTGSGLSLACSDCYARFFACSRTMCPGEFECPTPRLAGNGCMRCQVDKGCARAFMTCTGLDHMPLGTLLLPLPN